MSDELVVKFWGVRGSHPVPGQDTVKYGGNTACVEVRAGERRLILDAGTGIIGLGREMARQPRSAERPAQAAIFLSHLHHDHIQGFPFFVPAFLPAFELFVFGPGEQAQTLEQVLEDNQSPVNFPVSLRQMAAHKHMRSLQEHELVLWDADGVHLAEPGRSISDEAVVVRIHRSYSHPGGSYAYRISWRGRSIVYATDVEGYVGTDRRLAQFSHNADLLIHDAQYSDEHYRGEAAGFPATQGYGHSTPSMACETATSAGVARLVLFHHDPAYADARISQMETRAQEIFPRCSAACEGMQVRIKAGSSQLSSGAVTRLQNPAERALPPRRLGGK
jgi:phosphoribosyl 1,2-cyclic phosphodiesterase